MAKTPLNNVRIVLVNTTHPGNIGAVARAMKNMGIKDLCLVAPKKFPHERAYWRAANATDIVDQANIVSDLAEALQDRQIVIGTSARGRSIPWPMLDPRTCAQKTMIEQPSSKIAIVFGREDRGLTNEELQMCHYHLHIPGNPEYSVLNIATAVQVVCYELRMAYLDSSQNTAQPDLDSPKIANSSNAIFPPELADWDEPFASHQDVERFLGHLAQVLTKIGFYNPSNPRHLLTRIRRLFLRSQLDQMEVNILRGVLSTIEKQVVQSEHTKNTDNRGED